MIRPLSNTDRGLFLFQKSRGEMSMSREPLTFTRTTIPRKGVKPIDIYRRLRRPNSCLLESRGQHRSVSRYSFIGINVQKQFEGCGNTMIERNCQTGATYTHQGETFHLLRSLLPKVANPYSFPLFGGLLGYIGYEVGHPPRFHKEDSLHTPDVLLHQYETLLVIDHQEDVIEIIQNQLFGFEEIESVQSIIETIQQPEPKLTDVHIGQFQSTHHSAYAHHVEEAKRRIDAGEVEQVVLSRRASAEVEGDALVLYERLTTNNPSPYQFYFDFGTHELLGASPESVVKVQKGKAILNPIAGTRRRGKTAAEDEALMRELLTDDKELDEHQMLVEQAIENLSELCEASTIQVTQDKAVMKYEKVMHLVSEVEGQLRRGDEPLDCLRLSFPAGTVTGSPKEQAMIIIDELEQIKRGFFGGAVGYISFASELDFALTIRSMMVQNNRAYIQAGAGIVKQSTSTREFEETEEKMQSLVELSRGESKDEKSH